MRLDTALLVVGAWIGLAVASMANPSGNVVIIPGGPVVAIQPADLVAAAADEASSKSSETEEKSAEEKTSVDAAEAEKKKKEEEEKKKKERLEKIKAATFDRTIAARLKAWSGFEEQKEKAAEEKKPEEKEAAAAQKEDELPTQIAQWQKDVTLGNWEGVKAFLESLSEEEAKVGYNAMLNSLKSTSPIMVPDLDPALAQQLARIRMERREPEPNSFTFGDVMGLISCVPFELDDPTIGGVGAILRTALQEGNLVDEFVVILEKETSKPEKEAALSKRVAAKLLRAAGQPVEMGTFLPDVGKASKEKDFEGLNLLSIYYQNLYNREREEAQLVKSWEITQAVLEQEGVEQKEQEIALKRAVELSSRIDEEMGKAWLEESFANHPERGMEILRVIGSAPSSNLQNRPTDTYARLRELKLQSNAVESLLEMAPDQARNWSSTLHMLAMNWLREAEFSYRYDQRNNYGFEMQRDRYGNIYYMDQGESNSGYTPNRVQAIASDEIIDFKPSEDWLKYVEVSAQPSFDIVYARLYLKIGKEDKAFPYIEAMAKEFPDEATSLANEYLRVWTTNHDPNANRNRTNYYMYMYGYERKAESIPLTRSKQERNLKELAEVIRRLQTLDLEELDERLLARAFTTSHSSAEVYRLEAIEKVFGSMDALEPKTLAQLTQQMRGNLASVWRMPAEQKDKKTKRKQKDIEAEVIRGYEVCRSVLEAALKKYPEEWRLQLAKAAIEHDANNYQQELNPDSGFTEDRLDALDGFAKAAEMYASSVDELPEDEESAEVYELWYYASLGACDLGLIDDKMVADQKQPALIRAAIDALPGERAERHLGYFANSMFTRMSAVKPAVKYAYLRGGFEIVGDHDQAAEAREVFDYYKDLVTELQLVTEIDGSDTVGHETPFGVFVNLRHTKEIERESGGFGRYLQNQNSGGYYYYNYGRPLENYRDKFETIVRQAMEEQFEVLSVTFQREDVNSRAVEPYGWRETPYAYILLKARGPEVDRLPSLRLDLDFLDTSGYAVLPIESPLVPIDASPKDGGVRPVSHLKVTQTLDERQAEEGKLILEIVASAHGLVPELDELLDLEMEEFEIVDVEDQGLSVSRFDPEAEENVVVSERSWLVNMKAADGLASVPGTFEFGEPILDGIEPAYQRYVDADLAAVERVVSLEEAYGSPSYAWIYWVLILALVGVLVFVALWKLKKAPVTNEVTRYQMPDQITPFTVLGLLKQIQRDNGFEESEQQALAASITKVERFYFDEEPEGDQPELQGLAQEWVLKAG